MSTLDQFDIAGRSAIVTGGASGLGLAFVETLVEAGCRVTLVDRDADAAQAAAAASNIDLVQPVQADVRDRDALHALFDEHADRCDGLDILFANAGIGGGPGFWNPTGHRNPSQQIDNFDPEHWDNVIAVNLTGVFNCLREAARVMKAGERGGTIIVTSSNAALFNQPLVGIPYMGAKAGVAHVVRHAALELAAFGIRVNAIAPGSFVTNIAGGWLRDPDVQAQWAQMVPIGGVAEVDRVKPLALYLASDASSYVTGTQIVIDGGVALGQSFPVA